ncbi:MAG: hypothetical protein ACE5I3_09585 [Phycisphaerae bacterium]
MRTMYRPFAWRRLALLAAGATFFLSGCDPQIRATVENGIITASTSLLGALLQAFIQLGQEANDQTARLLSDFGPIFA